MALKDRWKDKIDGEDYVMADDVNAIAQAVIELESTIEDGSNITMDSELSLTSENPVQNKIVAQEFKAFNEAIGDTNRRVSALESGGVGGGGVSSWNDLTDKPFGENADGTVKQLDNKYLSILERKSAENVLLSSYTGMTEFDNGFGVYALSPGFADAQMFLNWHGEGDAPIVGNIFVEFDGVTYECAQQRLAALDNGMAIGNCAPFGGAGNDEPFICTILHAGAYYWAIVVLGDTAPTEHTVRVYQPLGETKYILKEEYLPDGIGGAVAQPASIDLSGLETNGTIVETYADGTTKTTTLEFDASGNPIKITDGDGNVTTLTW